MKKRIFAMAVSLALIISAAVMPASSVAAEEAGSVTVTPKWFAAETIHNWASTDTNYADYDNFRFTIAVSEDSTWKFTLNYKDQWTLPCRSFENTIDIDLDKTPYLTFDTTLVAENCPLMLRFGADDNVEVAVIQPGSSTVSVNLLANDEILKRANADNVIRISGVVFTLDKFYASESVSFKNFAFSSKGETNAMRRDWFEYSADQKWFNDDYGFTYGDENGRFMIKHFDGGLWQYFYRWKGTPRVDCHSDTKMLNLDNYNMLNYNVSWSSQSTDVYLIVLPFSNDNPVWGTMSYIKVGTIPQGASVGGFDLKQVPELMAVAKSTNDLYISGMAFGLDNFNSYGEIINVQDISFGCSAFTASAGFTTTGTTIAKNDAAATVTVNADTSVSDSALTPVYQWYVDGVAVEGANSATYTIENTALGKHSVYGTVTVGSGYYAKERFISELTNYGAYVPGNVTFTGTVSTDDLISVKKNLIGSVSYGELENAAADVTGDTKVDIKDMIRLKKYLANVDGTVLG